MLALRGGNLESDLRICTLLVLKLAFDPKASTQSLWAEAVWKRGGDVGGVGDRSISGYEVRKEGISRSPRLWEGDLTVSGRPDVAQDDVDQRCMASISPLTPSRATIRLML